MTWDVGACESKALAPIPPPTSSHWDVGAIEAMPTVLLPTITFITPNGASFNSNDVTVRVAPRRSVRVELFRNGKTSPIVVSSEAQLPAVTFLRWQAVSIPKATYVLTAYAYDDHGNQSLPAKVTVTRR